MTPSEFIERVTELNRHGCSALANWLIDNSAFTDSEVTTATNDLLKRASEYERDAMISMRFFSQRI